MSRDRLSQPASIDDFICFKNNDWEAVYKLFTQIRKESLIFFGPPTVNFDNLASENFYFLHSVESDQVILGNVEDIDQRYDALTYALRLTSRWFRDNVSGQGAFLYYQKPINSISFILED